jgi:anti-sigma-K factor RskA
MDENPYRSPESKGSPGRSFWHRIPLWVMIVVGAVIVSTVITLVDAIYVKSLMDDPAAASP